MNYLTYGKRFKRLLKDNEPIMDKNGNKLDNPEKEKWVQCYNPKDKVRKQYPKYLFVSDKGNFVSLSNINKPKLLTPSITSNGRESYNLSVNGKTRKSLGYIVVAVCHGAKAFGKADEIMASKGRLAFGKSGDLLQIHHEEGYIIGDRATNNNPEKLTILTINIHQLFQKVPPIEASEEEQIEFLQEFADRIRKETNEPVIMIPSGCGNGTIKEVWDEDSITQFKNKEWTFFPLGDNGDLYKKWNEDEAQRIENMVIEHCKTFLRSGNQTIVCINTGVKVIPFIVFRK